MLPMPFKNKGAILVISLILLIVLSGLVIAGMNLGIISLRVGRNYSGYAQAREKATTMAAYAVRLLDTYTNYKYPLPKTCTSVATCYGVDNTFPYNGRQTIVWSSGLDLNNLVGSAGTNAWWTTYGLNFGATYAGGGNERVIVSLLGAQTSLPYENNYQVVGYATDLTGRIRATSEPVYFTINGYRPDPYPAAAGTNLYNLAACTGGCPYGQCCKDGVCSASQATCETCQQAFPPDGWYCNEYFVTGKGYASTTCNNNTAIVLNGITLMEKALNSAYAKYLEDGDLPEIITMDNGVNVQRGITTPVNYQGVGNVLYRRTLTSLGMTGVAALMYGTFSIYSNLHLTYAIRQQPDGTLRFACGMYSKSAFPMASIPPAGWPPYCTCEEVNTWFEVGTGCVGQNF